MPFNHLFNGIFSINSASSFNAKAIDIFSYQKKNNQVYSQFVETLGINHVDIKSNSFPLLPVNAFKNNKILCQGLSVEAEYTSSTTSGTFPSRHYIHSMNVYHQTYLNGFKLFYGAPADWCILALLPSYLEREGSSLIDMCKGLMEASAHEFNGFFLNDTSELIYRVNKCKEQNQKVLLIGVTFALLDLAEIFKEPIPHVTIMETGGMKGRRKEITKNEMHEIFRSAWNTNEIHSEYGMTEMLSQCYSKRENKFICPPWVKIIGRQPTDLLSEAKFGETCVLGVIDLANIGSCSFLLTEDLGKVYSDGSFEVLGRMDNAEIRGCNLMAI